MDLYGERVYTATKDGWYFVNAYVNGYYPEITIKTSARVSYDLQWGQRLIKASKGDTITTNITGSGVNGAFRYIYYLK